VRWHVCVNISEWGKSHQRNVQIVLRVGKIPAVDKSCSRLHVGEIPSARHVDGWSIMDGCTVMVRSIIFYSKNGVHGIEIGRKLRPVFLKLE